jgi:hypothetical protein
MAGELVGMADRRDAAPQCRRPGDRKSVECDPNTAAAASARQALFFGFGGEVAVSVIAVSSTEGSPAAWSPTASDIFAFRVQPVTDRRP